MTDTNWQSGFLQRVKQHIEREKSLLNQLQLTLQQLGTIQLRGTRTSNNEPPTDMVGLGQISSEAEALARSRGALREEAATLLEMESKDLQFAGILERLESPIALELRESLDHVRRSVTRTFGLLRASIRSLLIERQLVEVSLEALGVGAIQETYDESGERLIIHPESHLETRS